MTCGLKLALRDTISNQLICKEKEERDRKSNINNVWTETEREKSNPCVFYVSVDAQEREPAG